jgi:hypothetical protein
MGVTQENGPRLADLEQAIKHRIVQRTCDRIHGLEVEAAEDHIVVGGRAASFHLKQLAIQGVFDVIGLRDKSQRVKIDVQIAVTPIIGHENWAAR